MKRISIYLFCGIFIFLSCQSPSKEKTYVITNKNVLNLRDTIANFNEVQSSHIGYAGSPSTQYNNYKNLARLASADELYVLTKDTNNAVATYATFGLIDKENPKFIDVFEDFLKTDKKVKTMKGCSMGSDFVSSEIYYKYWNDLRLSANDEKVALQKDAQLLKLDSLIIATNNADWLLYMTVFENRIYDKSYLPVIEKQAFNNENIHAIKYVFDHHKADYENQLIKALKNYLKRDDIVPFLYEDIFTMMHSFHNEELNALLTQELDEIKSKYGESSMNHYKKMLQ
ncbi:hypothetical protein [uncultured Kordia sp.]|uniref:hypothetical protein n=1 Tax=uncultured Kordia sp. TaxID=507699 RepID=UPI002633F095|nr:hypothetical protein [uncultured Kordia sp.]